MWARDVKLAIHFGTEKCRKDRMCGFFISGDSRGAIADPDGIAKASAVMEIIATGGNKDKRTEALNSAFDTLHESIESLKAAAPGMKTIDVHRWDTGGGIYRYTIELEVLGKGDKAHRDQLIEITRKVQSKAAQLINAEVKIAGELSRS